MKINKKEYNVYYSFYFVIFSAIDNSLCFINVVFAVYLVKNNTVKN